MYYLVLIKIDFGHAQKMAGKLLSYRLELVFQFSGLTETLVKPLCSFDNFQIVKLQKVAFTAAII